MMGSYLEQLLHDFNDVFFVLRIHTENLKASLADLAIDGRSQKHLDAAELCIDQMSLVFRELRNNASEHGPEEVSPAPLTLWSQQLQKEILPNLAKMNDLELSFQGIHQSNCFIVNHQSHCARICANVLANARVAGANKMMIELKEQVYGIDLIFRDNGRGMTADQIECLGLGFSSKEGDGHGQGFRIVRKLASEFGAVVRTPLSIEGIGTEIRISFMKVGCTQSCDSERTIF